MSKEDIKAKRFIIQKYIPKEKIVWPKEMTIAKRLWKMFPILAFWESLDPIPIESLVQLCTSNSLSFIQNQFNVFKLKLKDKEEHKISDTKIGEDIVKETKPTNLKEFLQCK